MMSTLYNTPQHTHTKKKKHRRTRRTRQGHRKHDAYPTLQSGQANKYHIRTVSSFDLMPMLLYVVPNLFYLIESTLH